MAKRRKSRRRKNPSTTMVLLAGGAAIAVGGTIAFLAFRRRREPALKPSGPTPGTKFRDPPADPTLPGTGPINPGPNNQGPPPDVVGPDGTIGWGGGQYGSGPIPPNFDWNGRWVYISEDCQTVAEPLKFLPIPGSQEILQWWMPINGGPSAQADLFSALGFITEMPSPVGGTMTVTGTAWGNIARIVARQARDGFALDPFEAATTIALQVMMDLNQVDCGDVTRPETWPKAVRDWWTSLAHRIEYGIGSFEENWYLWNEFWQVE